MMHEESGKEMLSDALILLAQHLGVDADELKQEVRQDRHGVDATIHAQDRIFLLELSRKSTSEAVLKRVHTLLEYQNDGNSAGIPLLVVPFMGEAGSDICRSTGVSWLDLSGNAHIKADGLTVNVSGKPNRYKRPGRPQTLFAAQSLRLTRWLLTNPDEEFTHAKVVEQTGLDRGYTTRILRRLTNERYIRRSADRVYTLIDGPRLLKDWRLSNRFHRHDITPGSCFATNGPGLTRELAGILAEAGINYAFTGLPAAWLYTGHVSYILTTLYIDSPVNREVMDLLGFHNDPRGANTWLVQPDDGGVFDGSRLINGIRCVHPVQVYIDLKDQPERAPEAADEMLKLRELSRLAINT